MNLELKNISHHLGSQTFSYDVVISEDITGVYGPSGAGKTTLLNIIAGLEKPHHGEVILNGKTLFNSHKGINTPVNKRNIGVVFQDNYLFPHLTIEENLNYSKPYHIGKHKYVDSTKVISLLDIQPLLAKKPRQLSGGERQRVAIGRALLSQPSFLLLDEPFSNLDQEKRKLIISYLLKINSQFNIPLLIISHDLNDILKLTKNLLIVKDGGILAKGDYLSIAQNNMAPNIIKPKHYLNTFDVFYHQKNQKTNQINAQTANGSCEFLNISARSEMLKSDLKQGQKIRLCLHSDEIALATQKIEGSSIQNQIKGPITHMQELNGSYFITVNCGADLVSEVTQTAVIDLKLCIGMEVYCLIKSKAIELIHVYNNKG